MEARIEDGKLFYEKRWFHRGQPVFVEGKDLPRTQGIISGISHDLVIKILIHNYYQMTLIGFLQ